MNAVEPLPPWAANPGARYEALWKECCDLHVHSTWLPFWNALDEERRATHLARFPLPPSWQAFLDDVAFDQEWKRIDADDVAAGVLQPNGMPWPKAPRPSFWGRLHGWLRTLGGRSSGRR